MQPDGKIVLAGFDKLHEFAVWRLDRRVAGSQLRRRRDGRRRFGAGFHRRRGPSARRKIVVAGGTYAAQTRLDMAVARLNPNGSLDKTFDPGGPDGDGKKV